MSGIGSRALADDHWLSRDFEVGEILHVHVEQTRTGVEHGLTTSVPVRTV